MLRPTIGIVLVALLTTSGCSCSSRQSTPPAPAAPAPQPSTTQPTAVQNPGQPGTPNVPPAISTSADTPPRTPDATPEKDLPKSRFARVLMQEFDKAEGGTKEERDAVRQIAREQDRTLLQTEGPYLRRKIEAANNTHNGPRRIEVPLP